MTTEKKKFANHVKNASAPLRYDSRCMGARWGGRGSDFQKSRSREPPYSEPFGQPAELSLIPGCRSYRLSSWSFTELTE
jgi:hypothetical protein